jgi:hypothetical protein
LLTWRGLRAEPSRKAAPNANCYFQMQNRATKLTCKVFLDLVGWIIGGPWEVVKYSHLVSMWKFLLCSDWMEFQNCSCFLRSAARSLNTCARILSGSATTVGFPRSASSQMLGWRGISARSLMSISAHFLMTPSRPKIECVVEQFGHVNADMFWTMPRICTKRQLEYEGKYAPNVVPVL